MTTDLVPKQIKPSEIFIPNGLDVILAGVNEKVKEFNSQDFNLEKGNDRDKIRSFAANVAKSKTFIDKARVEYVRDKKAALKVIDQEGKRFRESMDDIKEKVRKPLTDWEESEKALVEAERQLEIFNMDHEEALQMNDLFDREKVIAEKEAELARQEEEHREKEEAERLEKERIETEARIKAEAEAKAKKDAEDKIRFEREEKERIEREAQDAKERAEREAKEAAERAEREKQEAIEQAKMEAEEKAAEEKRLAEEKAKKEKEDAERKAANKRHQASVNNKILASLSAIGIDESTGKKLIIEIAKGRIPLMSINY